MGEPFRILFVCLGNICRSPLAEGVFRQQVQEAGLSERFVIASAGTGGWHVGSPPDPRMCATASARGVEIGHQRGRHLAPGDLLHHELVLGMDRQNVANIRKLAPRDLPPSRIELFRSFDPEPGTMEVPDPYYGDDRGFEEVFEIVERTSGALLEHIRGLRGW